MSKLGEKLARLLSLATLKDAEADDEARINEARTSAFLLLKICQTEGVKIKFVLPPEKQAAPAPRPPVEVRAPRYSVDVQNIADWNAVRDLMDELMRQQRAKRKQTVTCESDDRVGFSPGTFNGVDDAVDGPPSRTWADSAPRRSTAGPDPEFFRNSKTGSSVLLKAMVPGICFKCNRDFNRGERVWWAPGKASHDRCGEF